MIRKTAIYFIFLLFAQSSLAEQFRLVDVAKPTEQKVFLKLDPKLERYTGEVDIELQVVKATKRLQFNGKDYHVKSALLKGGDNQMPLNVKEEKNGIIEVTAKTSIKPGSYTLHIAFDAPYNRQSVGLYKTMDQDIPYLFTQFEMSDARRAFPVFDEPNYKIPFQLTIASPESNKVFSNTPEAQVDRDGDWLIHKFEKTPRLSSYLVALAVGPFDVVEVKGMPIPGRIITTKGKGHLAQYAAENTPRVLAALEEYFGRPYPYKKLDSVALPEFPFGAMENAGLITYREDILLVDKEKSSVRQRTNHVMVIAHEIAHQWYGNLVTMDWWNDLWLNEAFASWMAAKITHQVNPEFEYNLRLPQNSAMESDALVTTKPIRKPIKSEADIMDGLGLAYSKGSSVLSMLEQWLGEETFKQGVRTYINRFAWKNAKAADLWGTLSEVSKKDVKGVLQSYTEQSSFPLVSIQLDGKKVHLSQQRFIAAGVEAENYNWNVPVSIRYGNGDQQFTETFLLDEQAKSFELKEQPTWIYPDNNAKGYYRWAMDNKQLENLIVHGSQHLNVRERKALLSNSSSLMKAGGMSGADFLITASASLKDESLGVVRQALSELDQPAFKTDDNEKQWQQFILKQIEPVIERFGLEPREGEDPQVGNLRASLISLLAFEGNSSDIIEIAKKQAKIYLADFTKVDPALAGTYLAIAAFNGDLALYKQMVSAFEHTTDPASRSRLLSAISYFNDEAIHQKAMDYQLTDKITASDLRTSLYINGYVSEERRHRLQDWIFANYPAVAAKFPSFRLPSLPYYIAGVCSVKQYQPAADFFNEKSKDVPGYKRSLAKVTDNIRDCENLRERQLASVNQYLSSLK